MVIKCYSEGVFFQKCKMTPPPPHPGHFSTEEHSVYRSCSLAVNLNIFQKILGDKEYIHFESLLKNCLKNRKHSVFLCKISSVNSLEESSGEIQMLLSCGGTTAIPKALMGLLLCF